MKAIKKKSYGIVRGITVGIAFFLQIIVMVLLSLYIMKGAFAVYAVLDIIGVLVVFSLVNGEETYKTSWILIILLIPVGGLFLYFMWGRKHPDSKENKRFKVVENEISKVLVQDEKVIDEIQKMHPNKVQIARYLGREGFPIYQNTKATYFEIGEDMIESLLEDLRNAKHFIFLEYYIVYDGQVWQQILEILTQKVKEGVEVKLLFDDFGTLIINNKEFRRDLRERGIKLVIYNRIHKDVARLSFNYRNHQKIAIIDGNIGYTGGINLADEYANIIERFGHWKDTGVRLYGDAVWSLTCVFMEMWMVTCTGEEFEYNRYKPNVKVEDEGYVLPFAGGPHKNPNNPVEGAYTRMINKARDYIYITTPYLVLDQSMILDLTTEARSGVDIKIIVPKIYDKWVVHHVNISNYGELLEAGIKIYEYTPGFIHAKNIVVDDECAICGTINMDYRSFYHHYECGVFFSETHIVNDIKEDFMKTLEKCEEVTLEKWKSRPIIEKILQFMFRVLAPMM